MNNETDDMMDNTSTGVCAGMTQKALKQHITYEIMYLDKKLVAQLSSSGDARVFMHSFMPYNFWFDEDKVIDTLVNNMVNFYHWCSSRMLTLDRKYAIEIMESIGT